jgi:hypothetical protein
MERRNATFPVESKPAPVVRVCSCRAGAKPCQSPAMPMRRKCEACLSECNHDLVDAAKAEAHAYLEALRMVATYLGRYSVHDGDEPGVIIADIRRVTALYGRSLELGGAAQVTGGTDGDE